MFKRVLIALLAVSGCPTAPAEEAAAGRRFEISFPTSASSQPITGRLFLMVSPKNEPEVRLQSTWFNAPEKVAVNVTRLMPGQTVVLDGKALGVPLRSLDELPAGDYYVQAVLNVYTQFHRADGHVIWAHMDQWEGQQFNKSPGNLFSPVQKVHLDPHGRFSLKLTEVIPPIPVPQDTQWVKHVRIQSKLLSEFWGRPIYLGAVLLLPRDYSSRPNARYPVIYYQPEHFRAFPPFEFETVAAPESEPLRRQREDFGYESGYEFQQAWVSKSFPRMIAVSIQTPTPLSDWSGGMDSVNNGPYGTAIVKELIPRIEREFRIISQPYARVLTGKHSAGRSALALQVLHPEFFGGAWILHPWAFNFRSYFGLDIHDNENAFIIKSEDLPLWARNPSDWLSVERYFAQAPSGIPFVTFRQASQHDAVMAGVAAGDPLGADDAILGPVGDDGYPRPLWDRSTGRIDRGVADYWREHSDLVEYTRRNWATLGPDLVGKLHLYVGEMDHFYRNQGVHLFEEYLKTTQNPHYEGTFVYDARTGSRQPMKNAELVRMMADHVAAHTPEGADKSWLTE